MSLPRRYAHRIHVGSHACRAVRGGTGSGTNREHWLKESGDNEGYARLCTNIANLYQRLDQYQPSCDYYAKALEIFETNGDQRSAALIYQNLGYPLGRLDRFEEADAMYVRAEQLAGQLGMRELGVQASYNRAYLFFLRGRYSEALQLFARVRAHFRESGSLQHFGLCDLDEAEIYLQLNIATDASTLAQSASQQFKQIGMVYEEAKALAFHGVALMQMNRFTRKPSKSSGHLNRPLRRKATDTGLPSLICTERTSIWSCDATGKRTLSRPRPSSGSTHSELPHGACSVS